MRLLATGIVLLWILIGPALAGEPDWFTRVKEKGLTAACAEEVVRHEKGVLADSLHVGECYYRLERWEEGLAVFLRLARSPDRNYAAAARVRVGEGHFRRGHEAEAKKAFTSCLEEHPEAWLDGSVADRCRAWLKKLSGELTSKEPEAKPSALEALRKEMEDLTKRLAELKKLIEALAADD